MLKFERFTAANSPMDLSRAHQIRHKVFIDEAGGTAKDEYDALDARCVHFLVYESNYPDQPIATARAFIPLPGEYHNEDIEKSCYRIGRVAVLREFRGKNVGQRLMREMEAWCFEQHGKDNQNIEYLVVHARLHIQGFYEKLGWKVMGDIFQERGIPHVLMIKTRSNSEYDHSNKH